MKSIIVLFMLSVCGALCRDNDYFRRLDTIYQETPCSSEGGGCTLDCPKDLLARGKRGENLCPKQRRIGVECCFGVSKRETRCQKHGGTCSEEACEKSSIYENATDCPPNTVCCVRV